MEVEARILELGLVRLESSSLKERQWEKFQSFSLIFEDSNFKFFDKEKSIVLATIFFENLNFLYSKEKK